ncbi:hypothetical protein LIER_35810 [Lithospermum erythrorhizon]|uniref:RNase H type-1 domain-containing protein n=1 Tax=Lithospermum erythrorhizon TaxID=34254 RepID=A0AAV3NX19_LITER
MKTPESYKDVQKLTGIEMGLELVRTLGVRRILVRGDSKLMMDQIRGDCGIKNESLMKYHGKATTLAKSFAHTVFEHIPRSENEEADRLSKLATTYYEELPKEVYIEVREKRSYDEIPVKIILEESSDWRTNIAKFLLEGSLPANPSEARKVQRRSLRFWLYEGELYQKSFDGPLLLSVPQENVQNVLYEVHNGWYGSHIGKKSLATKITRMGFFWLTMTKNLADFVLKSLNSKNSVRNMAQFASTETPFSLVYDTETILPMEVGLPTWRQRGFEEEQNSRALKEQLNFIDELKDKALFTMQKYKHLMARSYNRRVKGCPFRVGDLVLKLYSASHLKYVNKLSPKWEGPYRVSLVLGPGTYELEEMDGKPVPRTWHASKLSKFYC